MALLLTQPGVTMRPMREDEWESLVSLCDASVLDAYERRGQPDSCFTPVHTELRAKLDAHIASFLAEMRAQLAVGATP